jgi:hypothetical protein
MIQQAAGRAQKGTEYGKGSMDPLTTKVTLLMTISNSYSYIYLAIFKLHSANNAIYSA